MRPPDYSIELAEAIMRDAMPSTDKSNILPGIKIISNAEYRAIVEATVNDTVIDVRGQKFDGRKTYDAKEIAALADRILEPDGRSSTYQDLFNDTGRDPAAFIQAMTPLRTPPKKAPGPVARAVEAVLTPEEKISAMGLSLGSGGEDVQTGTPVTPAGPTVPTGPEIRTLD
jgi:hypothetical protein